MPRLPWIVVLSLALGPVLGRPAVAADEGLTNREIIKSFERVVFGVEHDVWSDPGVTKWTKPIFIAVGGDRHESYLSFLGAKIDELVVLTGHPIRLVPFERSNTVVVFTPSVVDDLGGCRRSDEGRGIA